MLVSANILRCCICGEVPARKDYIEIELHVESSPA